MIWTVQPDGRHWMDDDGFGDEDQPAIALYTFIDEAGRFTTPSDCTASATTSSPTTAPVGICRKTQHFPPFFKT